jgi:hypothetical protein
LTPIGSAIGASISLGGASAKSLEGYDVIRVCVVNGKIDHVTTTGECRTLGPIASVVGGLVHGNIFEGDIYG